MATMRSAPSAVTAAEVRAESPGHGYVAYHAPRYATLMNLLAGYAPRDGGATLDIGRSMLTEMIRERFGLRVDTLGFQPDEESPAGDHYQFDLNDAQDPSRRRRDLPAYELVVMAEVIEHLYTAPRLVLSYIADLMAPGGVLVLQTPNAAALHKRLQLLVGLQPYGLIREDTTDPGHFREYTLKELRQYADLVGLEVERHIYGSYFDYRYAGYSQPGVRVPRRRLGVVNLAYRTVLRGSLRPGITLALRKPS